VRSAAKELVALNPDVIVAHSIGPAIALVHETSTIPIVFTTVSDPNASGLVESIARPKRNVTGFTNMDPTIGPKWLEILKEIAPNIKRVAVIFNPATSPIAIPFSRSLESAAERFSVEVVATPVHMPEGIETALKLLGREPGGGLILPPDVFAATHRKLIMDLADRYKLPAAYPHRYFVDDGGLLSYGSDPVEFMRQAAIYVDRILRGAVPSELPVQAPTKFELVINLKTAEALGLTVPPTLLAIADDLIEKQGMSGVGPTQTFATSALMSAIWLVILDTRFFQV